MTRHRHHRLPAHVWIKQAAKILFTQARSDYRFYRRYNSTPDTERITKRMNDMITKWRPKPT